MFQYNYVPQPYAAQPEIHPSLTAGFPQAQPVGGYYPHNNGQAVNQMPHAYHAAPMQKLPPFYGNVAGSPAFNYAGQAWPTVFSLLPEVEATLKHINTGIREGRLDSNMFPSTEMVTAMLQAETGARAELFKREMFTVDTVNLCKYIAQVYMHCKYMGKLQYPETPSQAAQFAIIAMYTEYGLLKGVRGDTPEVERQQLRSLQYLWGHIGGFIMLTHFPAGWDSDNALQRKAAGFDVLARSFPEPPRPSLWPAQGMPMPQMQGGYWGQQAMPQYNTSAAWAMGAMPAMLNHGPTPGLELYTTSSVMVNGEVGIDPRGDRVRSPLVSTPEPVPQEVGVDPRGKRPPQYTKAPMPPVEEVRQAPHVPVQGQVFSSAHWSTPAVNEPTLDQLQEVVHTVEPKVEHEEISLLDVVDEEPVNVLPEVSTDTGSSNSAVMATVDKLVSSRTMTNVPKKMGFTKPMP